MTLLRFAFWLRHFCGAASRQWWRLWIKLTCNHSAVKASSSMHSCQVAVCVSAWTSITLEL